MQLASCESTVYGQSNGPQSAQLHLCSHGGYLATDWGVQRAMLIKPGYELGVLVPKAGRQCDRRYSQIKPCNVLPKYC